MERFSSPVAGIEAPVFRFPAFRRNEARKIRVPSIDENKRRRTFYFGRDGEFSKGGGLSQISHLRHSRLSNYFGPPCSEFLTHSAAEDTVGAVCSQIFKVVSENRHDSQNAVGGTVCLSAYAFCVSAGPHQG